jgi:MYXO-CTERM domain-containing protein
MASSSGSSTYREFHDLLDQDIRAGYQMLAAVLRGSGWILELSRENDDVDGPSWDGGSVTGCGFRVGPFLPLMLGVLGLYGVVRRRR